MSIVFLIELTSTATAVPKGTFEYSFLQGKQF